VLTTASSLILSLLSPVNGHVSYFININLNGSPILFVCFWRYSPQWARATSFTRFLKITHNDVPQSVGLLWTSDQLVAETSTCQHTTITKDKHPCPSGIRTHNLRRRAAADLRLRTRGHCDRLSPILARAIDYLYFKASIPALGPTQPSTQWAQTAFSRRKASGA